MPRRWSLAIILCLVALALPATPALAANCQYILGFKTLHAEGRAAMVQPYLAGIDAEGETGLVYLGGRYSHAFRKGSLLAEGAGPGTGLFLEEEIEPRRPSPAEHAAADAALAALPFPASELLYARVDVAPGPDGRALVLEIELAEPSLYLWCEPAATDRFATAVAAWLDRP